MNRKIPLPKVAQTFGARILEMEPENGTISMAYDVGTAFTNPMGGIQGGILAALLDDTMSLALWATLDKNETAPTLELKINFIAPAVPGEFNGRGRIVSKGKKVCVLEGELRQNGNLVARSTATALIHRKVSDGKTP